MCQLFSVDTQFTRSLYSLSSADFSLWASAIILIVLAMIVLDLMVCFDSQNENSLNLNTFENSLD